jgi:hypothetical protein
MIPIEEDDITLDTGRRLIRLAPSIGAIHTSGEEGILSYRGLDKVSIKLD